MATTARHVSSHVFRTTLASSAPAKLPSWFVPMTQWRMTRARGIPVPAGTYLRPRGQGIPRNITVKELGWVLDEWDRWLLWEAWIDSKKSGPRPVGLWVNAAGTATSPGWAGSTLKLVHKYRPTGPLPVPPPPLPPAPHDYDVSLGFSWVVLAENPHHILDYPPYYRPMWTADPAYEKPSASLVERCKHERGLTAAWGDCHTTFPDDIQKMMRDHGLDTWSGEGESAPAFQVGMDADAPLMLINISALSQDQKDKYLRPRKTVAINELYLNQDRSRADRENWEGLPIAGRLVAWYDAKGEAPATGQRFPQVEYVRINKFSPHHDSCYDPGGTDQDRVAVR